MYYLSSSTLYWKFFGLSALSRIIAIGGSSQKRLFSNSKGRCDAHLQLCIRLRMSWIGLRCQWYRLRLFCKAQLGLQQRVTLQQTHYFLEALAYWFFFANNEMCLSFHLAGLNELVAKATAWRFDAAILRITAFNKSCLSVGITVQLKWSSNFTFVKIGTGWPSTRRRFVRWLGSI